MKKIISLCFIALFSAGIYAAPVRVPDSAVKIQKIFNQDFPEATFSQVSSAGDNYMVYYKESQNECSGRVFYDAKGNILQTYRYYSGDHLTPFIRARINKKFKGEDIYGVTEVTNSEEHYYQIVLKNSSQLFIIHSDAEGHLTLIHKYKRA